MFDEEVLDVGFVKRKEKKKKKRRTRDFPFWSIRFMEGREWKEVKFLCYYYKIYIYIYMGPIQRLCKKESNLPFGAWPQVYIYIYKSKRKVFLKTCKKRVNEWDPLR